MSYPPRPPPGIVPPGMPPMFMSVPPGKQAVVLNKEYRVTSICSQFQILFMNYYKLTLL